jgi:hypothetical protein
MHRVNGRRSIIGYIVYIGGNSNGIHMVNGRIGVIVDITREMYAFTVCIFHSKSVAFCQ